MSASFIPYHLRQNKAIDRNLFVETLSMVNRYFHVRNYEYISMGGPFLEDFKVVHAGTGIANMISLEEKQSVFARQQFNRPLSCIKLFNESSTSFITRYNFENPAIIWLDYTTPSRIARDLADAYDLVSKLKHGDVVKVTLNANANSIPAPGAKQLELAARRLEYLSQNLDDYLPSDADESMVTFENYPSLLFRIVQIVFDRALGTLGDEYFQPLTSYIYADGARMLTYCGIVLKREERASFLKATQFEKWNLSVVKKSEPIPISVPELSIKERMFLDSLLPKFSSQTLQKRLRHLIAELDTESLEGLENYVRYYKQFPYFSKIVP
jgi:hypothetical protein